jgi:hypothetical protein
LVHATLKAHTEGVIALPLETWVSLGTLIGFGVTILLAIRGVDASLRSEIAGVRSDLGSEIAGVRSDLRSEIGELRSEMKAEFKELRTEVKADMASLETRISELDRRVYALAVGLRPEIDGVQEGRASG